MQPWPARRHEVHSLLALVACGAMLLPAQDAAAAPLLPTDDLAELSFEQLGEIQVTSVSKQQEDLLTAAASIHVISHDDIRLAGATSLAEALRLAPGVEVARNGSHSWAISIRGFNSDISNKLLVLIDGRSVYSPLYAGVFWDVQDVLLEDVERIEVVSGPGGTLWGANAVNGVVNIITRSAADTAGGYFEAGGGDEEAAFASIRYGTALGEGSLRTYLKSFERAASARPDGSSAMDRWHMSQAGFRYDRPLSATDHLTLQGDLYAGQERDLFRDDFELGTLPGPDFPGHSDLSGSNLLGRWTRLRDSGAELNLQLYYDHTRREIPNSFTESRDTIDFDFQHHPARSGRHDILWGLGLRATRDRLDNTLFATFDPEHRSDRTFSAFVQDKIALAEQRLYLTLGSKFERNDYTGFEFQPNARLTWLASPRQTLWAAVSRAVRIPSRLDTDLRLTAPVAVPGLPFPVYVKVNGDRDFQSEELLAKELGYRWQARDNLSFDTALFYNRYDKLQTTEPEPPQVVVRPPVIYLVLPNTLANGMAGNAYGGTLAANWNPTARWRLQLNYAHLRMRLHNLSGSRNPSAIRVAGNSPRNQLALFSFLHLSNEVDLFAGIRHVDELPNQNVDSYTAVDLGVEWNIRDRLSLSIHGKNLGAGRHAEFSAPGAEVERSVMAALKLRF